MKDVFKTVSQIAFLGVSFIFITILTAGFNFNSDFLGDPEFWGEVLVKEAVLLLMFSIVFDIDLRNRKSNKTTKYFHEIGTKQIRIARIYEENLFDNLHKAVEAENIDRQHAEMNRLLHKVTLRITYKDLPLGEGESDLETWLTEIQKKCNLSDKVMPHLRKVASKILSGKYKVNEITEDGVILDFDKEYNRREQPLLFDAKSLRTKQTATKCLTFLLSTSIMTGITFTPTWVDFWQSLLVNVMLMLSAVVSAISSSVFYVRAQTQIVERQNSFLCVRMGLKDKWIGVEKN